MRATEIVFPPDVDAAERERLVRAVSRGVPDRPSPMFLVLSMGFLVAGALAGTMLTDGLLFLLLVMLLPLGLSAFWSWIRDRRDWVRCRDAMQEFAWQRQTGRVIVLTTDLDPAARNTFRTVQGAVDRVAASRACREGYLEGGLTLLEAQQWRIATALRSLSEARQLLDRTGARLAEHRDAVHATEAAIDERVHAVVGYGESVGRLDATLADIEAASQTATLDHKLRDALDALGEDRTLDLLATESRNTHAAMAEALRALRHQTELLRSSDEDVF